MRKNVRYAEFTKLKSPEEVLSSKSGSCHDQVMFELHELRAMGYKPKAIFMIELDPDSSQGGMTHSLVYYTDNKKICWFEHAWGGHEGIREFGSPKDIEKYIRDQHNAGSFGNKKKFPVLLFGRFGNHSPGESVYDFVSRADF